MGKKWCNVSEEEMYVFISFQLLMGLTHLPKISDYWSTSPLCHGPPVFRAVMSHNRFFQIIKFLRFSHPDDAAPRMPMTRIRTYLELLRAECMEYCSAVKILQWMSH